MLLKGCSQQRESDNGIGTFEHKPLLAYRKNRPKMKGNKTRNKKPTSSKAMRSPLVTPLKSLCNMQLNLIQHMASPNLAISAGHALHA